MTLLLVQSPLIDYSNLSGCHNVIMIMNTVTRNRFIHILVERGVKWDLVYSEKVFALCDAFVHCTN